MAEVEQGRINQENALEEQQRNAEEAAEAEQRRLQCMELITQIADLERERDKFINRLRRLNHQLSQESILKAWKTPSLPPLTLTPG